MILIDSVVGIQSSDKMLIEMLNNTQRTYVVVLTKADKLKEKELEKRMLDTADFLK